MSDAIRMRVTESSVNPVKMRTEQVRVIHDGDYSDYDGPTAVTPVTDVDQVLETEMKLVHENIVVHPIPYAETSNLSGGYTVIIGA